MKNKKNKNSKDKQSLDSDDLFEELKQKEGSATTKFDMLDFFSKDNCTAYYFGKLPIEQKGYVCSVCDKKKKNMICRYCHSFCHDKCRGTLIQNQELVAKREKLGFQKFACHCGVTLKHTFDLNIESYKNKCNMMKLDQELDIPPYHCISHDVIVCCICAVVCHKDCTIVPEIEINSAQCCNCISDFHSNFNEMALSFPLEQYKKIANIDIWPIQLLNILFSTGKIFRRMKLFFKKFLSNEVELKSQSKVIVNKFSDLLELFSNTFNRKFKSYYYHEEIINIFPYQNLFTFIKNLEVNDGITCIIKFRLLFILLFIHLKKDYQVYKSLTSNDFLCNNVLQRLLMKKLYRSNNIFSESINKKYKINKDESLKNFALKELCNLITKGMKFISVEENQDEFEIGLKILCFMLKRLMFNKQDLILLIDSLYNFYLNFYDYIMSSHNNIYSLLDIFNAIVELCFMISVNYNDLIIEEGLESNNQFSKNFIITRSEHSNKLLIIIFMNCDIFSKHYDLLIKPEFDQKSKEEKKREEKLRKHLLIMQQKILSKTTGIPFKIPENGGLLKDKIIILFNETLSIFSLTDNLYQKQLEYITEEDLIEYNKFCEKLENKNFYKIMKISKGKEHSNILLNLKIVLEEVYFDLFTTSYIQQQEVLEKKVKTIILNACDEINKNIEIFSKTSHYSNIIKNFQEKEKEEKKENDNNKEYLYLDEDEIIKRKILKDISVNINFAKTDFLLIDEGRELIVDNFITSQIDETLFKGLIFLTNIHFPNIISHELIRLYFHFLAIFLMTKRGIRYLLIGKNLKNIQRLINRLRYDPKNKNLKETKGRTTFFNVNSIKVVIHFLCLLSKFIKLYNIKTINMHKALINYQRSIITHIKYYGNNLDNEDAQIEFKQQLKECLEIFNNLFEFYTYNEFEYIKFDFIDIFRNCPLKLLNPDFFQKWFDRTTIDFEDPFFKKKRKWDLAFYFQFFELITKNTFYVYDNDVYGKKLIDWLKNFFDIDNFSLIISNSNDLFSFKQKTILFYLVRTYYLIDCLNQVNYLKKEHLLTTGQYKKMINNNLIKDKNIIEYIVEKDDIKNEKKNNKQKDNINEKNDKKEILNTNKIKQYSNKLIFINEFITLINIYINEIYLFPKSILKETSNDMKNYIIELVFAIHDISTIIYYSKDIINKILPHYYKLGINFIKKKNLFLKIFEDIEENKKTFQSKDYVFFIDLEKNDDFELFTNRVFNVFDKEYIYKLVMKNIFEIYKKTNINKNVNLENFLKIYDLFNEANFPPFSLLEVKDYEYFYEQENDDEEKEDKKKDKSYEKFNSIRNNLIEQYKNITTSSFLGISSGESTNKKIDYSIKYINLFKSFINSVESANLAHYRTLLCIMVKLLLYDGDHIQTLLKELAYDKYFFKNLNRELNYHLIQCINSSKKYDLFFGCVKITDITKLTIQFIQLLGEGFNIDFHDNIFKGIIKKKKVIKKAYEKKEENKDKDKNNNINNKELVNENEESESEEEVLDFVINQEDIDKIINMTVKNEMNKRRVVPLINIKTTIYETMINNLQLIYHLMSLNTLIEGELAFDKLCVTTSNIIDFIIEFIDTKKDSVQIIDYYIKSLFFGKKDEYYYDYNSYYYFNNKGILSIFSLNIKDEPELEEENDKYKIRKTMVAYMKIKYLQLLKAYLQIGNKSEFIHLMITKHLGPFQLFAEIIYYMKELINKLVAKDYQKYKKLLNVNKVNSYVKKLNNLYIFDEDFRTSIEMSVIFQICLILITLEEIYKITTLKDFFKNEKPIGIKNIDDLLINEDEEDSNSTKESKEENNEIDIKGKENIKEDSKYTTPLPTIPTTSIRETTNYYQPETYRSNNNLVDEYLETNEANASNINFSPNKPVFQEANEFPYTHLKEDYKKRKNKKIEEEKKKKELLYKKKIFKLDEENFNLDSVFVKAIYIFLCSIISKVEIRLNNEDNSKGNNEKHKHFIFISNKISKDLIKIKNRQLSDIEDEKIKNNENYDFEEISENEEIENNDIKIAFFIRPYLTFYLSEQSKYYFINNVNRSHISDKYSSLINFSDYCIFEMMYNMRYVYTSKIKKKLSEIDLYYIQIINYILILLENALLMYHYYRGVSLDKVEYDVVDSSILNKRFPDIFIIIIIKICIIGLVFFIWFLSKFIITYQRNIIFQGEGNFIFRKSGESTQNINQSIMVNYFRNKGSLFEIIRLINKDLNILKNIKIALFDTIFANLEINIFVFSLILNLLFLAIGNPIFLSIETIFIVGIFPSLLNIFKAFTAKFSSLIACLIFTYLVIYIYNWLSIFYLRKTIDFGEVLQYQSGQFILEPFCHSSIQCYLVLISYGTRAGGGIGDNLPVVSYKNDTNMFIARFFYDMTFYILVIMIMGNVTFGLIVDSFGGLRDETYNYENDKDNICFICQLSRDGCLLKNIDFDSHINNDHNIWNYVDFLCNLHLYDPNNFSRIEGYVWDKLIENDFGWIPLDTDEAGEEE